MLSRFLSVAAATLFLSSSSVSASSSPSPSSQSSGFLLLASDSFSPQLPSSSSPIVSHSASYSHDFDGLHPGLKTQLDYTVEHNDNVWLLDTDLRVNEVTCTSDNLSIRVTDATAAQAFLSQMVMGETTLVGHCVSADGSYGEQGSEVVFGRQILSVQQPEDVLISFQTTIVDATQIYKHANVSFSTNSYGMFSSGNNHCSVFDILRKKCSAVVNETKEWSDLFHYDYSGHTLWSGSIGSDPKVDASITCSSCFAKLTPELIFNLQIADNKLVNVAVLIQGNFASTIEATVSATGSFSQSNSAIPVYTISVPDVVFYVGAFPIHVKFSVPITASYDVSVTGQASAMSGVEFHGDLGAGFGYDNGQWGPRFTEGFGYDVVKPTGQASGNGQVKVGLTPSFRLSLDLIASGQVDVAPYLELDVEASSAKAAQFSAQGQLYAGVDVDVQGTLGITFHGHNIGPHESFGPKDVYSIKKQIWSGAYPAQVIKVAPTKPKILIH